MFVDVFWTPQTPWTLSTLPFGECRGPFKGERLWRKTGREGKREDTVKGSEPPSEPRSQRAPRKKHNRKCSVDRVQGVSIELYRAL